MNIDNPKKISKQKTLLIIFQIIGIILVFATIHSFYNIYKKNKNYAMTKEEIRFIDELRKNKYLSSILLEDPLRGIELINKKIG